MNGADDRSKLNGIITNIDRFRSSSATPTSGETDSGRVRWESQLEAELAVRPSPSTEKVCHVHVLALVRGRLSEADSAPMQSSRLEVPSLFATTATAGSNWTESASPRRRLKEDAQTPDRDGRTLSPQDRHYLNRILVKSVGARRGPGWAGVFLERQSPVADIALLSKQPRNPARNVCAFSDRHPGQVRTAVCTARQRPELEADDRGAGTNQERPLRWPLWREQGQERPPI